MRKSTVFKTTKNHDVKHKDPTTIEQALENLGLSFASLRTQHAENIAAMKEVYRKTYKKLALQFHLGKILKLWSGQ